METLLYDSSPGGSPILLPEEVDIPEINESLALLQNFDCTVYESELIPTKNLLDVYREMVVRITTASSTTPADEFSTTEEIQQQRVADLIETATLLYSESPAPSLTYEQCGEPVQLFDNDHFNTDACFHSQLLFNDTYETGQPQQQQQIVSAVESCDCQPSVDFASTEPFYSDCYEQQIDSGVASAHVIIHYPTAEEEEAQQQPTNDASYSDQSTVYAMPVFSLVIPSQDQLFDVDAQLLAPSKSIRSRRHTYVADDADVDSAASLPLVYSTTSLRSRRRRSAPLAPTAGLSPLELFRHQARQMQESAADFKSQFPFLCVTYQNPDRRGGKLYKALNVSRGHALATVSSVQLARNTYGQDHAPAWFNELLDAALALYQQHAELISSVLTLLDINRKIGVLVSDDDDSADHDNNDAFFDLHIRKHLVLINFDIIVRTMRKGLKLVKDIAQNPTTIGCVCECHGRCKMVSRLACVCRFLGRSCTSHCLSGSCDPEINAKPGRPLKSCH